jgi:steroid delta-isomerase-like uncharacterized protein
MNTENNTTERIIQLVGELANAWNRHDIEKTIRLYAENYHGTDISETAPRYGRDGVREWIKRYWEASPDMYFTCEQTVVQGSRAAVSWKAQGTHRGYLMHIPPTGREFTVRGVSLLTIEDDQIQRGEYIWDLAELLRCIRLLPELRA